MPHCLRLVRSEEMAYLRAFAVDEEYPEGYELKTLNKSGSVLWELERAGQEVVIVSVLSSESLPEGRLRELLEFAAARPEVVVHSKKFSRPR